MTCTTPLLASTSVATMLDMRMRSSVIASVAPTVKVPVSTVVTGVPRPPCHYKRLLPDDVGLVHRTIEVHECADEHARLR